MILYLKELYFYYDFINTNVLTIKITCCDIRPKEKLLSHYQLYLNKKNIKIISVVFENHLDGNIGKQFKSNTYLSFKGGGERVTSRNTDVRKSCLFT